MTATVHDSARESFQRMTDGFTQALQSGLKFQEQTLRFWADLARENFEMACSEWEKAGEQMSELQARSGERFRKLADEQMRRGADLLKKTTAFAPTTDPAEFFDRLFATWRSTADMVREMSEAAVEAQVETMKQWCEALPRPEGASGTSRRTARATTRK